MNTKNSFLLLLFLIVNCSLIKGQSNYCRLDGTIIDSANLYPLSYATIHLTSLNDSTKQFGVISDEEGFFQIEKLPRGNYNIEIRFVGYNEMRNELVIVNPNTSLDTIKLVNNSTMLTGVEIKASIFKREIDKLVMYTDQLKLSEGSNVIDLLEHVPGVSIQNDQSITLIGKEVMVMINGKPIRMSFDKLSSRLKSQASSDIKKVEIMLDPSAKYLDEWEGGMLNIVTRNKILEGVYGSIYNHSKMGKHYGSEAGFNLNYRKSFINAFFQYGAHNKKREVSFIEEQSLNSTNEITSFRENNNINTRIASYMYSGLDFEIDKNNVLELLYNRWTNNNTSTIIDSILFGTLAQNDTMLNSHNRTISKRKSQSINIYYKNLIDTDKHYFTIEANYSVNNSDNDQDRDYNYNLIDQIPYSLYQNRDMAPQNSNIYFIRSDYYYSFKSYKIESGIKWSDSHIDNSFIYEDFVNQNWISDVSKNNKFVYDESIISAYASIGHKLSEKINYRVGLRINNTIQYGESSTLDQKNDKKYTNILPSALFTYTLNKSNELTFSYYCTMQRPYFEYLNPFIRYENPRLYYAGNPDLIPSKNNKFTLRHRFKSFLWSTLSYSTMKDGITLRPITNDEENSIIGYKYDNFETSSSLNLTVSFTQRLHNDKITLRFTPIIIYNKAVDNEFNFINESIRTMTFANASYSINKEKRFEISISGIYMSGRSYYYEESDDSYKLGFSISRYFFKNKLSCRLDINDILNTEHQNTISTYGNIMYTTVNNPDSRYIRIVLRYNFQSKKVKRYYKHEPNNEELGRTRSN